MSTAANKATPKATVGIVVFPGSNCERDCADAVSQVMGAEVRYLWHREADLQGVDAIILPGGFSYGDYLRAGALAKLSPLMRSVAEFAQQGRPVVGICNGFQILTEAHLLPGCLVKNTSLQFLCTPTQLIIENNRTVFTSGYAQGQSVMLPVAHAEGNFVADNDTLDALEGNGQVVFRYAQTINGAARNIAGICNDKGNVLGMMPHPERNLTTQGSWTGEGVPLFTTLATALATHLMAA
jgi:phosphoribosylformylglycinamidine synthase subunit PurQ / glutaminase